MSIEEGTIMKATTQDLKRLLLLTISIILIYSFTACSVGTNTDNSTQDNMQTIVDMANREVSIPYDIQRIYAADPGSAILVYTAFPDKLIGWSYKLNDDEAAFIKTEYRDLPIFGMNAQVNYEAVITADPDIAIMSGSDDEKTKQKAEDLQKRIGVPVIVVNLELLVAPDAYLLMGDIIGDNSRGEELSKYAQNALDSIRLIPEDERVSIYYANGVDSLNTSARGTAASQLFDIVYTENVCEMESETGDRLQVTKEHLLRWNPDIIFVNGEPKEAITGESAATDIYNNPEYANLKAVLNNNVFSIPKAPFAWLDRPRSENRLIGIRWLGSITYPEYYDFNNNDIKEFYKLFYHMDITDEQISILLNQ